MPGHNRDRGGQYTYLRWSSQHQLHSYRPVSLGLSLRRVVEWQVRQQDWVVVTGQNDNFLKVTDQRWIEHAQR